MTQLPWNILFYLGSRILQAQQHAAYTSLMLDLTPLGCYCLQGSWGPLAALWIASIRVQIRLGGGKTILSTAGGHFQSPNWQRGNGCILMAPLSHAMPRVAVVVFNQA